MNSLTQNFLNQNKENQNLYIKFKVYNDESALHELKKNFEVYMFKLKFCSYISKSIDFYSKSYKQKNLKTDHNEILSLNIKDENFHEEIINMICDKNIDFIDKISKPEKEVDFKKIISDWKLVEAIEKLSQRQKEILYKSIILQKKETELGKELGISRQAVNKCKRLALNKLKNELHKLI